MARRNVYICYHRQDQEFLDQLLIRLDPLGRQDRLKIWTDREILAGAEPDVEISRSIATADAAIVLVSPDLLASDVIRDRELQRLVQAREDGRLILLPLFLRHVPAGHARFTVENDEGSREIDLTRIKGLNDPRAALASLAQSERGRALADIVEAIDRRLEALPTPAARPTRPRRELTIILELRGKHVSRSYGQTPHYDLHVGRSRIDLERFQTSKEQSSKELGRKLFDLLLGPKSERQKILSKTYGRDISDPLRHAFRIRIRTDDEPLRALPWLLCRWRQHLLVDEGWSFELASSRRPRPLEHLHTPCRALMLTGCDLPDRDSLRSDAHHRSLEGLLRRAWKLPVKAELLHRATTLAEFEYELEPRPDLLYVYGHTRGGEAGTDILLADDAGMPVGLPFADLAERIAARPPRLALINTLGDGPTLTPIPGVAALLHLRHRDSDVARAAAGNCWEAILGTRLDPVRALCELPAEIRRDAAATTDYQKWALDHSDYVPKVDRPRAHLDRRDQRRVVLEAVEELVRKPKRRVTCLVAFGADGNLVEHFAVQMLATLKERADQLARLEHHHLALPRDRDALTAVAIEEQLREFLRLQPSQPLADAFRRVRRGGPRAKPVHFLDWGTFGEGHQPPLTVGHLETWLDFCRDHLAAACPTEARLLAYLSLMSTEERHKDLEEIFTELKLKHHEPHFDLVALPALGTVEAEDLLRFLAEDANSSCPPALQRELPARIVAETGGSFEATVKLLEETERGNRWYELTEELPGTPSSAPLDPGRLL